MKSHLPVALALATALAAGQLVLSGQTPTFSARLNAVRVDALVTDRGQIVRGLSPADFEVLDNGVMQQVDLASFEELPLNVVLALDMSESVSGEVLEHLQEGGRAVLSGLKGYDKAGLITFSHRLTLRQELTGNLQRLRDALTDVGPQGQTSLVDGTYAAMLLGEADAGRDLLIVFSDGVDTASWLTPESVLESARRSEVTVYAVSVRGQGKARFLDDITEVTGGAVVEIESTKDLSRTFLNILAEFRQRYVVSYSPRGVPTGGWHRLQVRIKGRRATVKARAGYFGT
jgi:Ca-activated chloride channel family protein